MQFFPPLNTATPEGLLTVGGDLQRARMLEAYRRGIFPWYADGQPIMWWSPDPRCVLFLQDFKISRSLKKTLRSDLEFSFDCEFEKVINACARARDGDTWISADMKRAYIDLHNIGVAHSVEVWRDEELVGGLYGISLGRVFFGESMFSLINDASKVALAMLVARLQQWDFAMIDCQIYSPHLASLGAIEIPRAEFVKRLNAGLAGDVQRWRRARGCVK